eukprot:6228520-Alexandrium_andersonii.AAC.1
MKRAQPAAPAASSGRGTRPRIPPRTSTAASAHGPVARPTQAAKYNVGAKRDKEDNVGAERGKDN